MHKTNHTHSLFFFLKNKEMSELYLTLAFRNFTLGLLSLFIPVFLYKLGYSFIAIIMYFIWFYLFAFVGIAKGTYLCSKIGVKHTIFLSLPLTLTYFILLYGLEQYKIPLILIGLVNGIGAGFFWSAFHVYFSHNGKDGHRGKEVSTMNTVLAIASAFAPVIGGAIAGGVSFKALFIFASVCLMCCAIPLFLTKEKKMTIPFKTKQLFSKKHFLEDVPYIGEGMRFTTLGIFWPFYIYLSGLGVLVMGLSLTLANFFYIIFTIIMGMITDTEKKMSLIKMGAVLHSASIFLRGFVTDVYSIMFLYAYGGITGPMLEVPFLSLFYENTSKTHGILVVVREFYLVIGRVFILLTGAILYYTTNSFFWTFVPIFILGGLSCYLTAVAHKFKKPEKS
ncbi:MFS transporter [Candidatus Woesearchaeota archaeon]|nr:MFS transporter [Candidatus Woesearchaeota archaeon]